MRNLIPLAALSACTVPPAPAMALHGGGPHPYAGDIQVDAAGGAAHAPWFDLDRPTAQVSAGVTIGLAEGLAVRSIADHGLGRTAGLTELVLTVREGDRGVTNLLLGGGMTYGRHRESMSLQYLDIGTFGAGHVGIRSRGEVGERGALVVEIRTHVMGNDSPGAYPWVTTSLGWFVEGRRMPTDWQGHVGISIEGLWAAYTPAGIGVRVSTGVGHRKDRRP